MTYEEAARVSVTDSRKEVLEKAYKKLRYYEKKHAAAVKKSGKYSPAIRLAEEKGVFKNLPKNSSMRVIQKRLIAAQKLAKSRTGTLAGLREYEQTISDRLGVNYGSWKKTTKDAMWEMYDKMNSPQFFMALGSEELQKQIAELTSRGYRSEESIVRALTEHAKGIYDKANNIDF